MNYEAVYRTAPATPGLLNTTFLVSGIGCQAEGLKGEYYTGKQDTTKGGVKCIEWSQARSYKDTGSHNYCRNPR